MTESNPGLSKTQTYIFMNDRTTSLAIQPASDLVQTSLAPGEAIEIEIPTNTIPFIKVWDRMVLLTYMQKGND